LLGAVFLCVALALGQADFALLRATALARYGPDTADLVDEWRAEISAIRELPDAEKLIRANNFFNARVQWVTDPEAWQQSDYWATPLEVMGLRRGDCEDFAIAKYVTLRLAGVDVNRLRITYVKLRRYSDGRETSQAHMVLAYYPSATAEPVILDNIIPDIYPASKRTDLTPVYGFNSRGLWVGTAPGPATKKPEAKLSRWRDLLRRAAEEGLG